MAMNRKRKAGGLQSILDSIYRESVRRGPVVTFLVSAILSIGLGYLVYTYFIEGWVAANRAERQRIAAKEQENQKTEAMLASEAYFRAQFKKVADLFDDAKPLLPEETEIADVLANVETAAQRNHVTLTGLQAVKQSAKSPSSTKLYEREIPAVVTGAYPDVVRFFGDISRMPRILLVRDYSIVSLKRSVSAGFTLVAFHAPPPAEMPALPKDLALVTDSENR
jgi:Tfp pilus assembly protein PilO